MSKPVKALLRKELVRRLDGTDSLTVLSLVGVPGVASNELRGKLRENGITVTVVKNSVARQAFKEVGLESASGLLDGPSAVAVGGESVVDVVRQLLDFGKTHPALIVRGALLEGEVFGPDRVEELSKYPTRDEAIANVAGMALSPGRKLAGALLGPGGRIAGGIKTLSNDESEN
jgi:large subunit ribosomal protein L10